MVVDSNHLWYIVVITVLPITLLLR